MICIFSSEAILQQRAQLLKVTQEGFPYYLTKIKSIWDARLLWNLYWKTSLLITLNCVLFNDVRFIVLPCGFRVSDYINDNNTLTLGKGDKPKCPIHIV